MNYLKKNQEPLKMIKFFKCRKLEKLMFVNIVLTLLFISCSNDGGTTMTPTLSNISPTSGPKTTVVTINGSNFGTDINTTQVFFNDKEAVVQAVSETQITAIVPARAYTGLVKVIANGIEITGSEFDYIITEVNVSSFVGSSPGFADGTGANAQFKNPSGITIDKQDNIYIVDTGNHKIRKVTPSGVVSTLAGRKYSGIFRWYSC